MPDTPLYPPLPHRRDIRLLRIKSGTDGEDIEVTLQTFKLDSDTQFTALSYVWGDKISPSKIVCNGHRISITSNLWGVLSQLRRQQFDCLLWVDAICINQKDDEEKSFQVAMMRDIYKRAANVIFWLGEQECYDEDAVHLMRIFSKRYPHRRDLVRNRVKTLQELGLYFHIRGWCGWASLFSRPWFGRVWIVQEFVNAKNSVFMSGALEIPTELLAHCGFAAGACAAIGAVVARHSKDAHETGRAILRLVALGVGQYGREIAGDDGVRIFDLWCRSQQLEATDPRDRVFALLSTQTAVGMDMIDYSKDEATVYRGIAAQALSIPVPRILRTGEASNDLHRVSRFLACKFRSPQSSSLPSWVPDWKPIGFNFVPLTRYYTGTAIFKHPYSHAIVEDKTLSISGTILDEPHVIVNSMPYMQSNWPTMLQGDGEKGENNKTWAKTMSKWMHRCYWKAMFNRPGSTEHERSEEFCRTMAFGVLPEEMATPAANYVRGFLTLFSTLVSIAGEAHRYPNLPLSYEDRPNHDQLYESKFGELSAGRKFCVTKKGFLAWVPRDTRLSDRICILAGCAVMFVVRPVGQSYELLGDCYRQDMVRECDFHGQEPNLFVFQ